MLFPVIYMETWKVEICLNLLSSTALRAWQVSQIEESMRCSIVILCEAPTSSALPLCATGKFHHLSHGVMHFLQEYHDPGGPSAVSPSPLLWAVLSSATLLSCDISYTVLLGIWKMESMLESLSQISQTVKKKKDMRYLNNVWIDFMLEWYFGSIRVNIFLKLISLFNEITQEKVLMRS